MITFLWILSLGFQSPDPRLEQMLEIALKNNGYLQGYDRDVQARLAKADAAQEWDDPVLMVGFQAESVETRVGPQRGAIGVQQAIPYPGSRAAEAAKERASADVVRGDFAVNRAQFIRDFSNAYYDLALVERELGLARKNLSLLRDLEAIARTAFRNGDGPFANVLQIQLQLASQEENINRLGDDLQSQKALLAGWVGPDMAQSIAEVPLSDADPMFSFKPREHAMLKKIDRQINLSQTTEHLAEYRNKPSVSLSLQTILTDGARMPGISDSGKDPIILSANIRLPVFKKRTRAAIATARLEQEALQLRRGQLETELEAALEKNSIELKKTKREIVHYRDTLIPLATMALESASESYRTGSLEFATLWSAQKELLSLELQLEKARVRLQKLWITRAWLAGEEGKPQ